MPRAFAVAALAAVIVLGALLRRDAVDSGFWADDYLHAAMLEGRYPRPRASFDLFRFADGSQQDFSALTAAGYYPWWTHPDFQLSMFRPLASVLHAADHALLRGDARAQHLHSFAWWVACVLAAYALLSTLLPRPTALLATSLFALDESMTIPLVWLSNRSVLIAMTFGALGLCLHVSARRSGHRGVRLASLVVLALSLASGEYAVAVLGYLVAYEWLQRDAWSVRVRAAAPILLLAVCVLGLGPLLGYGSAHSGLYTSPLREPLAYLAKLSVALPVLSGDLLLGLPADYYSLGPPFHVSNWSALHVGAGCVALALAAALLRWLRTQLSAERFVDLAALSLGAVLALMPVASSFVTSRLALPAALGAAALLATTAERAFFVLRASRGLRRACALLLVLAIAWVHLWRASEVALISTRVYGYTAVSRSAWALSAQIDDATAAEQTVVLVAAGDANDAAYLPYVRAALGRPAPARVRLLSPVFSEHELRRVDAHTLELKVLRIAAFPGSYAGSLTRGWDEPMQAGAEVAIAGMSARVLAVRGGNPVHVRFRFDAPLDSPSLVFLQSVPGGLRRLSLPEPGAAIIVPAPLLPDLASLAAAPPEGS
jgi:hypothetical protein